MNNLRVFFVFIVIIFGNCFYLSASDDLNIENETYTFSNGKVRYIDILNKNSSYVIRLSDKSQWMIKDSFNDERELQDFFSQWNKKDFIEIIKDSKNRIGEYFLKNKSNGDTLLVELDKSNRKDVLAASINKIDTNGYFIATDNELYWTVGWFASWTSINWKVGDKIIINNSDDSRYLLVNLNTTEGIYVQKTNWK